MEPQSSKLQHRQQEETVEAKTSVQKTAAQEFESPEQMLRADVAQTVVPESVKTRLTESVSKEPLQPQPRPWWRRLLL